MKTVPTTIARFVEIKPETHFPIYVCSRKTATWWRIRVAFFTGLITASLFWGVLIWIHFIRA